MEYTVSTSPLLTCLSDHVVCRLPF